MLRWFMIFSQPKRCLNPRDKEKTMQARIFGKTGIKIHEVGLGTWQLGDSWAEVAESDSLNILKTAYENGVNFFDTADVYGQGRSESIIGKFRKMVAKDIFIATKLGRLHGYPNGYPNGYSYDLFKKCTEDSLKRLGVEAIDLTQLHCIPPSYLESGEVFDWLKQLQDEGKIRAFGASVESMDEALNCMKNPDLVSLQIIFNIFRQKPIDAIFKTARQKNIALIIRLPLASGLLSGKFTKQTKFADNDHRNYNRDGKAFNVGETFAGIPFEKGVELVEMIKPLVPETMTMAQFAMRWILDFEEISVVIPGATRIQHVLSNTSAGELPPLPFEIHGKLQEFYRNHVHEWIRGPY